MPDQHTYDPRFALTAVDDPPLTETGVMLMGLDAERLLAGLGMAALADDPAQVALAVDRARHGVELRLTFDTLVEAGVRRWREARAALDAAGSTGAPPASLRKTWERTLALLETETEAERETGTETGDGAGETGDGAGRTRTGGLGAVGPATAAHLAACWLRHAEVDQCAARRAAPQGGSTP